MLCSENSINDENLTDRNGLLEESQSNLIITLFIIKTDMPIRYPCCNRYK